MAMMRATVRLTPLPPWKMAIIQCRALSGGGGSRRGLSNQETEGNKVPNSSRPTTTTTQPPANSRKRRRRDTLCDGGDVKEELVAALPGGWADVREVIKAKAQKEFGFTRARVTTGVPSSRIQAYKDWVSAGHHGDMTYLGRQDRVVRREDLNVVVPGVQAVISLFCTYWPGKRGFSPPSQDLPTRGIVSCYAWGDDYHDIIGARLQSLCGWVHETYGGRGRWYVDTGPIMERDLAERAGLGFIGKNTLLALYLYGVYVYNGWSQINEHLGSGHFLAEILTTLPIEPDPPRKKTGGCGSCSKCLNACPTQAFRPGGYSMDARKCVSYLTIEHKGAIDPQLRPKMGRLIYGCDICQKVCPWNRFDWPGDKAGISPLFGRASESLTSPDLLDLLLTIRTEEEFKHRYQGSAIHRIGRVRFHRNVAIALGNSGEVGALPGLRQALNQETDEIVREHLVWAIERLEGNMVEEREREAEVVGAEAVVAQQDVVASDEAK